MRELIPAIHPLLDAAPVPGADASRTSPPSRTALTTSIVLHLVGVYLVGLIVFRSDDLPSPIPSADFVWLEARILPPTAPQVDEPRVIETPVPPTEVETESREPPAEPFSPPMRVIEEAPTVVTPVPPEPVVEAESPSVVAPSIDFEAESRRAAAEVVEQRERQGNYLSFSIRDVAPARIEEEPEPPSIFDGAGASAPRGPTVGRLGQTRTRFGAKVASLCNAVTGGGFSLMGWGSFCGDPDDEPSGLFPEVMPEYLTLMPECGETQPTDVPREDPTSSPDTKCRLVPRVEEERWAFPGPKPERVDAVDDRP
jgi:hypothetical protein